MHLPTLGALVAIAALVGALLGARARRVLALGLAAAAGCAAVVVAAGATVYGGGAKRSLEATSATTTMKRARAQAARSAVDRPRIALGAAARQSFMDDLDTDSDEDDLLTRSLRDSQAQRADEQAAQPTVAAAAQPTAAVAAEQRNRDEEDVKRANARLLAQRRRTAKRAAVAEARAARAAKERERARMIELGSGDHFPARAPVRTPVQFDAASFCAKHGSSLLGYKRSLSPRAAGSNPCRTFDNRAGAGAVETEGGRYVTVDASAKDFIRLANAIPDMDEIEARRRSDMLFEHCNIAAPYLAVEQNHDGTWEVVRHDGRHRAEYLMRHGRCDGQDSERRIRVRLFTRDGKRPPPFAGEAGSWARLTGSEGYIDSDGVLKLRPVRG